MTIPRVEGPMPGPIGDVADKLKSMAMDSASVAKANAQEGKLIVNSFSGPEKIVDVSAYFKTNTIDHIC